MASRKECPEHHRNHGDLTEDSMFLDDEQAGGCAPDMTENY